MRFFLILALTFFVTRGSNGANTADFEVFESRSLRLKDGRSFTNPSGPFYDLPLQALIFVESGWTFDEIIPRMSLTADIYSQCGITVREVRIHFAHARNPQLLHPENDPSFYKKGILAAVGEKTRNLPRPLLVYAKSSQDKKGYNPSPGLSTPRFYSNPEMLGLADMAWIFKEGRRNQYLGDTSVEAHELAHLLLDSGHLSTELSHLLSSGRTSNHIPEDLCVKIRKSELLRKP